MGAKKTLDVVTGPYQTAAATADLTIANNKQVTAFRVVASVNGAAKTKWVRLDTAREVSTGGRLDMADQAIYFTMGTQGSSDTFTNAIQQAGLDAMLVNTDAIEWGTGTAGNETSLRAAGLADTLVNDAASVTTGWDAAVAWV
jgi:hypothetical protein